MVRDDRARYLMRVRDPILGLVAAIGPTLLTVSPHIVADPRPSGGSLLRSYRDTRFTRDKTPYKTNVGFMAAGMWRPGADALRAIRQAIVTDPRGWERARRSPLSRRC